jgi:preprotein translocase subunit YajC
MFITPAYAQAAGAPSGNEMFMQLIPFVLIFIIMYFLILRPQQKKMKAQKEMVTALKRGDQVILSGGMKGKITKVIDDSYVEVEIADKVNVTFLRGAVAEVLNKGVMDSK